VPQDLHCHARVDVKAAPRGRSRPRGRTSSKTSASLLRDIQHCGRGCDDQRGEFLFSADYRDGRPITPLRVGDGPGTR